MNVYEETKYYMTKYNVHPNKRFGQNFLIEEAALEKMAEDIDKTDIVLEIGPGLGTLTSLLSMKAKKVIAVEIDPNMGTILEDRFKLNDNVEIVNQDVLELDLNEYGDNIKVVANLPYYITTPIITKLLKTNIKDMRVLIQKEVAVRMAAEPGDKMAAAITYFINYYADAIILRDVESSSFIPSPKVTSSILKLEKLEKPRVEVKDEEFFFELIKENFTKRRKTITNSLSSLVNIDILKEALDELGLDYRVRGENLSLEQFAKLADLLYNKR